jgi:hypothetical protein
MKVNINASWAWEGRGVGCGDGLDGVHHSDLDHTTDQPLDDCLDTPDNILDILSLF